MSSRHPSGHKFFRRTSKSPLYASQVSQHPDTKILNYQPPSYPNVCMKSKVPSTAQTDKDLSISISSISDENHSTSGFSKLGNDFKKYRETQRFAKSISGSSMAIGKSNEDIKFTYIPLQSMATLHSLPTAHKIAGEAFESTKPMTITKQEYQIMRKEVETLRQENRQLLEKQKAKNNQNLKLSKQIQIAKKNSHSLENDVKKLKESIGQAERALKIAQINNENLRKNLEATEYMKNKYQQNYKEVHKTVLNLESQLRSSKDHNSGLARVISSKEAEIKDLQAELTKQQKRLKSLVDASTSNELSSPRVLRSKSTTFQQNKPPQQKQPQKQKQLPVKNPIQKYNRHTQTQCNNLQKSLKQIQMLSAKLQQKQSTIKNLDIELNKLTNKCKEFDEVVGKLNEFQAIIGYLNEKVVYDSVVRLAGKYKYC